MGRRILPLPLCSRPLTGVLATLFLATCAAPSPSPSLAGHAVDTDDPAFTNPTSINTPLFPVSTVAQLIHLGVDRGQTLRVEVTLLSETRVIDWEGQEVETLVSQFISYRDGRIVEVANDYFAQADDGSVWYFGEEVDNYEDGTVANHGGSWLAGRDGPPGMIMPADPQVGDVFHPENIPGLVFEEVIVVETDIVTPGPTGEITGAIRVTEHLMEGSVEEKIWAPGYGEFRTEASDEEVTVALAVPTDARDEDPPAELARITDAAELIFDAVTSQQWASVPDPLDDIILAWKDMKSHPMPPLLADQMNKALADLSTGADGRDAEAAQHAAVDTALAALDIELQYRDAIAVDLARMAFWARGVTADAGSLAAVRGDVATLETIWERVRNAVGSADAGVIEEQLTNARTAADAGDVEAAVAASWELGAALMEAHDHAS